MESNDAMDKLAEGTETLNEIKDATRRRFADFSDKLMEKSRAAASSTDSYVREYAWSSVALAALLGVVVGLMIKRS